MLEIVWKECNRVVFACTCSSSFPRTQVVFHHRHGRWSNYVADHDPRELVSDCQSPLRDVRNGTLSRAYSEIVPPTRVLIVDDHPLVRGGLRSLLERNAEFEVIAEGSDGYEAIELATLHLPDVVLLDVAMPRLNGTDAAQYIREKAPRVAIIMISMHADESYILRALKSGARGYLLKASPESEVLAAIRAVASGQAYFSPVITRILVEEYVAEMQRRGVEDSYDLLTLREKEIMQLLVTGKTNKDLADKLNVSVATIETHRNNIFQKLHVHNLPELILYAVRKGLVS